MNVNCDETLRAICINAKEQKKTKIIQISFLFTRFSFFFLFSSQARSIEARIQIKLKNTNKKKRSENFQNRVLISATRWIPYIWNFVLFLSFGFIQKNILVLLHLILNSLSLTFSPFFLSISLSHFFTSSL